MFKNREHITNADAYLLAKQIVEPGLSRELREDTLWESRKKKVLGIKTAERVNHLKLVEGTKQNVRDILEVIDKADPLAQQVNARGYTDKIALDFGKTPVEVTAEMLFIQSDEKRALDIYLKGTGYNDRPVDAKKQLRIFNGGDVRVPAIPGAIFDSAYQPVDELPMNEDLVEFYDITGRVANAVDAAHQVGTLAVHGPSEFIARLQSQ